MSTHLSGAQLEGRTVYASDGEKLGKVDSVLEDDTGTAQYVEVKTGWFGSRRHTIPVHGLTESGDDLTSAYTKEQLESAPTFDEGEEIDYDRERAIGSHYGTDTREWDDRRDAWLAGEDLSRGPTPETRHPAGYVEGRDLAEDGSRRGETGGLDDVRDTTQGPTPETRQVMRLTDDDPAAAGQPSSDRRTRGDVGGNQDRDLEFADRDRDEQLAAGAGAGEGYDTSGPITDEAMTRSEEELRVGTREREAGRVRLRKRVETEPVSETVTTRHETARVEREPITDANVDRAMSGPEISEEEHEMRLTAEEAVVEKQTVPKERVRLEKDVVEEDETITDELRKERIEAEGDIDEGGRGRA
jgi:uncharacterized protein (TIGR02271 family)